MGRRLAVAAAVLLVIALVLSGADVVRGHPPSWPSWMLLLGMSLGISGTLLREPRWRIPLSIASLIATLIAATGLLGGR